MSIEISATKVPIRTRGDGHWKKYTYQDIAFSITLSGLLTFDEDNWTGWDMLDNMFNFSHVLARVSFEDADGNIRTVQGYVMIETSTLSYSPGNLVKDDFQMQGNGKLIMFDGLIPCPSVITDIIVDGQTDDDGIIHITFTFSGDPYQVKYRIDDSGDWVFAVAGATLNIPGLAIANHTIEIIPICANNFEGTGREERFQVTQGLTCGTVISDISINGDVTTAQAVFTGSATQMKYRVDGGVWITNTITFVVSLGELSAGDHTIEMVPICANNVEGTGFEKEFTITSQPAQSKINWNFSFITPATLGMKVYVDGVLYVSETDDSIGFFNVNTGQAIRFAVEVKTGYPFGLIVSDVTTSTFLNSQSGTPSSRTTYSYTFTATGGHEYACVGAINNP